MARVAFFKYRGSANVQRVVIPWEGECLIEVFEELILKNEKTFGLAIHYGAVDSVVDGEIQMIVDPSMIFRGTVVEPPKEKVIIISRVPGKRILDPLKLSRKRQERMDDAKLLGTEVKSQNTDEQNMMAIIRTVQAQFGSKASDVSAPPKAQGGIHKNEYYSDTNYKCASCGAFREHNIKECPLKAYNLPLVAGATDTEPAALGEPNTMQDINGNVVRQKQDHTNKAFRQFYHDCMGRVLEENGMYRDPLW